MPEVMSICKTPKDAYLAMADKGSQLCQGGACKCFHQAVYAGCYIGFGGQLSMNIAGGIAHMAKDDPGLGTFVFAALFPVNLLIILLSGGVLITGVSALVPIAVLEGKAHWMNIPKYFTIAWIGNLVGSLIFAYAIQYVDLNTDVDDMNFDLTTSSVKYTSGQLCGKLAKKVAEKKVAKDFFVTFVKGIGCNWMVCMAVFLCGQAQDMCGKYLGIWFPISTFVMIGFEHIPANFYLMLLGLLADGSDITFQDVLVKNWIPVTLGNFVAGAFIVAGGYSCMFGRLGSVLAQRFQPKQPAKGADLEAAAPVCPSDSKEQPPLPDQPDQPDQTKLEAEEAGEAKKPLSPRVSPETKKKEQPEKSERNLTSATVPWDRCVSEGSMQGI